MPRIVRCKIEMDLIEEEHFHLVNKIEDNPFIIRETAEEQFLDILNTLDNSGDLHEYVQSEIIDESD